MSIRFCAHCGSGLPNKAPVKCARCGSWTYSNAIPTGSAVIVRREKFLSVLRARPPGKDEWDIPGGFCDGAEHPAQTAQREVAEEIGLRVDIGPLIGLYVGEYFWQGDMIPTLNAYYLATPIDNASLHVDNSEVAEIRWFPLNAPPPLAFVHQNDMILDAAKLARR